MATLKKKVIDENSGSDDLRRELEGKIEKKVPIWIFLVVFGALGAIGGTLILQNLSISTRLTTLETKAEYHKW